MKLIKFIEDQAPDKPLSMIIGVDNDVEDYKLAYAVMAIKEMVDDFLFVDGIVDGNAYSKVYDIAKPYTPPRNWIDLSWQARICDVVDYFAKNLGFHYEPLTVVTQYIN